MTDSTKTIRFVLDSGAAYLRRHGVEESMVICEMLVARLLNCKRLELSLHYDLILSEKKLDALRRGMKRVAAGEPVQYVLGQTEFMGHIFKVDKRALIPRPETEELVERVLNCQQLWSKDQPIIADIGTGSGCIVSSLALARPNALYMALDLSEDALTLARENAQALQCADRISFNGEELGDLVEPEAISAIVANLPYIATSDYERLPRHILQHEPRQALDGGPSGLAIIELITQDACAALKSGGHIFLEIGEDQGTRVFSLLEDMGFSQIKVEKDLAGHDRIVSAVIE